MKEYKFYGWEQANVPAASKTYEKIKNPKELYVAMTRACKNLFIFSNSETLKPF